MDGGPPLVEGCGGMNERTMSERIDHRVHDEIHPCVRPGCGQRAAVALHVDEPMRLAARDFMPGEFVDLCPDHSRELLTVAHDAVVLGFGGPFDTPRMRAMLAAGDLTAPNPLDRLREWLP